MSHIRTSCFGLISRCDGATSVRLWPFRFWLGVDTDMRPAILYVVWPSRRLSYVWLRGLRR